MKMCQQMKATTTQTHQEGNPMNIARRIATAATFNDTIKSLITIIDAGVWPSGLVRWLVDFVLAVVGSNPSHG